MGTFNAQQLANTARAFATADVCAPELFAALAWHSEQRMDTFNAQELANTAWAFASAGVRVPELFAALAVRCEQHMGTFNAQDLANTAWAFVIAGARVPGLFAALAVHCEQHLGTFNARDLANTAWALANADVRAQGLFATLAPGLLAALAVHCEERMGTFNAQDLANTAWAFATAGIRAPGLFAALAVHCEQPMGTFNAQDLANTAWAFATAGVCVPTLFAALALHYEQRMGTFNAQELANAAWAFAAMYLFDVPTTSTAVADGSPALHPWLRLVVSMAELYLESAQAGEPEQLFKCVSAFELALLVCHAALGGIPDPRLGRLRAAAHSRSFALNQEKAAVTPSAAQLELSAHLRAAGWEHADDVSVEGGLLVVDMACTVTRVVVELDGPSHFCRTCRVARRATMAAPCSRPSCSRRSAGAFTGSAAGHGPAITTLRWHDSPPRSCPRRGDTDPHVRS
jgi:hypothetical protein